MILQSVFLAEVRLATVSLYLVLVYNRFLAAMSLYGLQRASQCVERAACYSMKTESPRHLLTSQAVSLLFDKVLKKIAGWIELDLHPCARPRESFQRLHESGRESAVVRVGLTEPSLRHGLKRSGTAPGGCLE